MAEAMFGAFVVGALFGAVMLWICQALVKREPKTYA